MPSTDVGKHPLISPQGFSIEIRKKILRVRMVFITHYSSIGAIRRISNLKINNRDLTMDM
jgi:hypothetical protein